MAKEIIPQQPGKQSRASSETQYVRPARTVEEVDVKHAAATKGGRQVLPTAWRPGDRAMFAESDQILCGQQVPGTLRGRVTLQSFRVLRGRRAWYVAGSLPTSTGGALAFEDDLRQVNGRKKIDRRFIAFLDCVMQPVEITD